MTTLITNFMLISSHFSEDPLVREFSEILHFESDCNYLILTTDVRVFMDVDVGT